MLNKLKDVAGKGLDAAKDRVQEKREQAQREQVELKERLAKMDAEGTPYCPKCYSTSLSANKRGWNLTTGFIGAGKIVVTCLKCGHKFKPGKR